MEKEGVASLVLRIARTVLKADLILALIVGVVCLLLDLHTFEAYGTLLVWCGVAMIFLACLIGIGGFASRNQDVVAFSLSRAGNISDNLQRVAEAGNSSLGCFFHMIFAGIGLIAFGYLVQVIAFLF